MLWKTGAASPCQGGWPVSDRFQALSLFCTQLYNLIILSLSWSRGFFCLFGFFCFFFFQCKLFLTGKPEGFYHSSLQLPANSHALPVRRFLSGRADVPPLVSAVVSLYFHLRRPIAGLGLEYSVLAPLALVPPS